MKGPCVVIICAVFNILHSYETKKITLHWQRAVAEVICHWKIVPKKQKDGSNMAVIKDLKRQSSHHRETSQLTYSENQVTGFYMIGTLAFHELITPLQNWIQH